MALSEKQRQQWGEFIRGLGPLHGRAEVNCPMLRAVDKHLGVVERENARLKAKLARLEGKEATE